MERPPSRYGDYVDPAARLPVPATARGHRDEAARERRLRQLWERAYRPGHGGPEEDDADDGSHSVLGKKAVDFTKQQVPLNYLTCLIYRKIVERTKCPQDQYREAYQMFGSPVGGISRRDFKAHLIRIGYVVAKGGNSGGCALLLSC